MADGPARPGDADSSGPERRQRAQGPKAELLQARLAELDPTLARWADEFVFGQVWERPGLDHDQRMLVAITALAATGRTTNLRNYLFGALHDGMSARAVHETLVMLAVYCGFPVAIEALTLWQDVCRAARKQGVVLDLDASGPDAGEQPLPVHDEER